MEMTEEKRATLIQVLEVCRDKGVTIEDLINGLNNVVGKEISEGNLEEIVSKLLREIGVAPSLKGYDYLRIAIILTMENKEQYLHNVTKALYPDIAKRKKTTSSRVERAIRHAIETAWSKGNIEKIDKIFSYTISPHKGKPTNSEFIAAIVDDLTLKSKK
ncbi:MAG: sporulation initiation factor Spo0A C-terminal domain-containing protein [Clostridia bacterium]